MDEDILRGFRSERSTTRGDGAAGVENWEATGNRCARKKDDHITQLVELAMQDTCTEHSSQPGFEGLSFKDLMVLPLEHRAVCIFKRGEAELSTTVKLVTVEKVNASENIARRFAWAIGYNIDGGGSQLEVTPEATRRGIQSYQDKWPVAARFSELWSTLTKTTLLTSPGHQTTLLDELALSVLCEQKSEWQDPPSRPVNADSANRAFDVVYAKNKAKVVGDIRRAFGERADNPETIADEAWARVFCDYWSVGARRRFLGLCRISTLVCQVARYVAIDMIRDRAAFVTEDGPFGDADDGGRGFSLEKIGVVVDPTEKIAGQQLEQKIRECIEGLPPKQRIVVEIVWLREVSAKEAAERLRISEPAVSQHLKKARDTLRNYLQTHGFDMPTERHR